MRPLHNILIFKSHAILAFCGSAYYAAVSWIKTFYGYYKFYSRLIIVLSVSGSGLTQNYI